MPSSRAALAAILFASHTAFAQTPWLESDGLYLRSSSTGYTQATRLNTKIDIEVTGLIARVRVHQRFVNSSDDWVEGIYAFPLPDDAAVDELAMQIDDRRIEGEIQEREQARQTYERALAAGQQASLVEQERPNLFTTSVANIAPGQEIAVEIGFLQTVSYDDGEFELRVPMTLTPRYVPEGVADAARVITPVLRSAAAASHRAEIDIRIDAGMLLAEASSSSHELETEWNGQRYELSPADASVPMDRDLVVEWRMVADQSPRVAAFTETSAGENFMLLMFVPPSTDGMPQTLARELIFVIDTSGSMAGNSMARARTALQAAIERLSAADRFNVIEFNSQARALFLSPVAVTEQAYRRARRFVGGLSANGGTNIASAVQLALAQPGGEGYLRQIVFITDGSVGNEAEVFRKIRRDLGSARLFTVGIGTAPNTHFMRKAAQYGRGSFLHIANATEVLPMMQNLFAKLEQLALTDIEIEWPFAAEVYPERVPDLYRGEPVMVAARTDARLDRALPIEASGGIGNARWQQRIEVSPGDASGVAAIWARRKIEALIDQRLEGVDAGAVRSSVLDVALTYGMLSPYTSLVAVDRTPELTRNAQLRRERIGNLLPAGSRMLDLPRTATDARLFRLIGTQLALLLLGWFAAMYWRQRRLA